MMDLLIGISIENKYNPSLYIFSILLFFCQLSSYFYPSPKGTTFIEKVHFNEKINHLNVNTKLFIRKKKKVDSRRIYIHSRLAYANKTYMQHGYGRTLNKMFRYRRKSEWKICKIECVLVHSSFYSLASLPFQYHTFFLVHVAVSVFHSLQSNSFYTHHINGSAYL